VLIQTSNVGSLVPLWFADICTNFHITQHPDTQRLGLKIVFPSVKTVEASQYGGPHGWYFYWLDKSHYVDDYLYDSHDERYPGLLLHSKIFLKEFSDGSGWCYAGTFFFATIIRIENVTPNIGSNIYIIGTANLSQAAWGSFQMNKRQFNVKNFELGVLFVNHPLLHNVTDNDSNNNASEESNNVNKNVVTEGPDNKVDPRANERFLGRLYLPFPKTLVKYNNSDLPWVERSNY